MKNSYQTIRLIIVICPIYYAIIDVNLRIRIPYQHVYTFYSHMDKSVLLIISFRDWKFETENRFRLIKCVMCASLCYIHIFMSDILQKSYQFLWLQQCTVDIYVLHFLIHQNELVGMFSDTKMSWIFRLT